MKRTENPRTDETRLLPLHALAADTTARGEGITVFIKKATEETLQGGEESIVLPKNSGAMPAATMLATVSYCYASDVYESERIEHKLLKDTKLKAALGMELPAAGAIRRFRRLNRETIRKVLEKAFCWLRRNEKANNPFAAKPNEENDTISLARTQAEQKLELASLIDTPN
jgi:hypothetical protein